MAQQHRVQILWNPTSCFGNEDNFSFDTKPELDAFMQGLAAASYNCQVDYETTYDSREEPGDDTFPVEQL
jgi:hypothetical protein